MNSAGHAARPRTLRLPAGRRLGRHPAGGMAGVPLDFDTLQAHGCFIGSAAIIVLSQHDSARRGAERHAVLRPRVLRQSQLPAASGGEGGGRTDGTRCMGRQPAARNWRRPCRTPRSAASAGGAESAAVGDEGNFRKSTGDGISLCRPPGRAGEGKRQPTPTLSRQAGGEKV